MRWLVSAASVAVAAGVCGTAVVAVQPRNDAAAAPAPPLAAQAQDPQAEDLDRRLSGDIAPLLSRYCIECHGSAKSKGDVRFDLLKSHQDIDRFADALGAARELLASGDMPPEGKPRPSEHERLLIDQWISAALDYVPPDAPIDPGWFTVHRLNRTEYRLTLRDLLGIDPASVDIAEKLPKDDSGYGFDNIADVLTVSPLAIEKYIDAAERAVEIGLGPQVSVGTEPRLVQPLRATSGGNGLAGGGVFLYAAGAAEGDTLVPVEGQYRLSIEAFEDKGGDQHARMSVRVDGKEVRAVDVRAKRGEPQVYTVELTLKPGRRRVSAHFINDYYRPGEADRNLGIESISIAGPINAESIVRPAAWQRVIGRHLAAGQGGEQARALRAVESFAESAFRRPLRREERESLLSLYTRRRREGRDAESAVRDTMVAVLVAPSFLFRAVEPRPAGAPGGSAVHTLSGHELALRLSYFLWSSMPDQALIDAAKSGELSTEQGLRTHVTRMLADPKADALIENFVGQWLHLRSLEALEIDQARFPQYTPQLRSDMVREATAFFGDVARSDASVVRLIDADYTFLNQRLAEHYGIAGVKGERFRRVTLADRSQRWGVLTMAGVLTVTSNTTRTSPVKRGLFVLEQVLGTPPPPPPADIPPLEQAGHDKPAATLREQLALHVANPTCAACHNRLDPIGLAFEYYDAIGRWRTSEDGRPIDASGTLPGGEQLTGPEDLRRVLAERSSQFIETLSGKLLTYAIGRGMEPFDRPAVRQIAATCEQSGGRFAAMVEAVVLSPTFRTCRPKESPRVPAD